MIDFTIHLNLDPNGTLSVTRTGKDGACNQITLEPFADLLGRNPGVTKAGFLELAELFDLNPRVGQKWLRRAVSDGRVKASWDEGKKRYELR